jgi:hypothetical protein
MSHNMYIRLNSGMAGKVCKLVHIKFKKKSFGVLFYLRLGRHRRRLASLDKIHGPRMRRVPKCSKFDGLFHMRHVRKKLVGILNLNYNF